ncbi:MAG TPA: App1 family protein, partial [Chryseolinea sp.]|nr:App1 family protein [Chryseolinea sp.]
VTSMRASDLSFTDYTRRRTFRTLLSLYRTKPLSHEALTLSFDSLTAKASTDASGFFIVKHPVESIRGTLQKVSLSSGKEIKLIEGLYSRTIHYVETPYMIVSDIDDTILHSFISRKVLKFRTLMFTPVEKRETVIHVRDLIRSVVSKGATPIYLSNSEQNLYPLIYRFLLLNEFPAGPIFLKQMRKLMDVFRYRKLPAPEVHKLKMLDEIMALFADKKFVLVGDNTQYDLSIYLSVAKKYPSNITHIFIRKVVTLPNEEEMVKELTETLSKEQITFHYAMEFSPIKELKE